MDMVFAAMLYGLAFVLALVALDMIIWQFGVDSRTTIDDDWTWQHSHRSI